MIRTLVLTAGHGPLALGNGLMGPVMCGVQVAYCVPLWGCSRLGPERSPCGPVSSPRFLGDDEVASRLRYGSFIFPTVRV